MRFQCNLYTTRANQVDILARRQVCSVPQCIHGGLAAYRTDFRPICTYFDGLTGRQRGVATCQVIANKWCHYLSRTVFANSQISTSEDNGMRAVWTLNISS